MQKVYTLEKEYSILEYCSRTARFGDFFRSLGHYAFSSRLPGGESVFIGHYLGATVVGHHQPDKTKVRVISENEDLTKRVSDEIAERVFFIKKEKVKKERMGRETRTGLESVRSGLNAGTF